MSEDDAMSNAIHAEAAPESPDAIVPKPEAKERRPNRTLAEKLEDLATSARTRIDKLQARELRLVQDLGKVRGELAEARAELSKITGSAERVAAPPVQMQPADRDHYNGAPF